MTARANPETIFNDLMSKAVDAIGNESFSEIELRRLERETDALASADRAGALEIRGHLAAVHGDDDKTDDFFERAIKVTDDFKGTVIRYMVVLNATGRTEKLGEVYKRFREITQGDIKATRIVAEALGGSGWVFTATHLDEHLKKMTSEPAEYSNLNLDTFHPADLEEADIPRAVGFCIRYLRSRKVFPTMTQSVVVPYENGTSSLLFQFFVDRAADVAAEIEWDMFCALDHEELKAERTGAVVFAVTSKGTSDAHCPH